MEQMNPTTGEILALTDVETSPDCGKLFEALAKAQGEIRGALKGAENPHFRSKYADLSAIAEACRVPLSKNGIAVVQVPFNAGTDIGVTTILGHSSGQWIRGRLAVKPMKFDAQGAGSVITYLRRYALAAMAGVAPENEDDDGEAAVGRGNGRSDAAEVGAPSIQRQRRTAAPPPPSDDKSQEARAAFAELKKAIQSAPHMQALDSLMKAPETNRKLALIKEQSETGYEQLMELATARERAMAEAA